MTTKISIIIVVYDKEIPELLFLLQSIDKLFDLNTLENIYIVVQGGIEVLRFIESLVAKQLSNLQSYIIFAHQHSILGSTINGNGWYVQQLLKLKVASVANSQYSLVLDCKNHFISKSSSADFVKDGKPLYTLTTEAPKLENMDSILAKSFINAYSLYDLDYTAYIDQSLGSLTPFVFATAKVADLIYGMEKKFLKNFSELFLNDLDTAEFYLYAAYLRKQGRPESMFSLRADKVSCVIWEANIDDQPYIEWIQKLVARDEQKIFGIHKNAYGKISSNVMKAINSLWLSRALDPLSCGYYDKVIGANCDSIGSTGRPP